MEAKNKEELAKRDMKDLIARIGERSNKCKRSPSPASRLQSTGMMAPSERRLLKQSKKGDGGRSSVKKIDVAAKARQRNEAASEAPSKSKRKKTSHAKDKEAQRANATAQADGADSDRLMGYAAIEEAQRRQAAAQRDASPAPSSAIGSQADLDRFTFAEDNRRRHR